MNLKKWKPQWSVIITNYYYDCAFLSHDLFYFVFIIITFTTTIFNQKNKCHMHK